MEFLAIELDHFALVTRSSKEKVYLDEFTFFTNSNLSGKEPIKVYIRNIEFLPFAG